MFERKNKSQSSDCDTRRPKRFTLAKPLSSDESFDKNSKDSLNKSINESNRRSTDGKSSRKGSRPSALSEIKEKKRDSPEFRVEKNDDLSVDNELLWIGKEKKKKEKQKKEKAVLLSEEQLLDYAAKEKLQEIFLYIFFLIVTTVVVLLAAPTSAAELCRVVSAGFMDTPFMNLANETGLLQDFDQHQVEPETSKGNQGPQLSPEGTKAPPRQPIGALLNRWRRRFGRSTSGRSQEIIKDSPRRSTSDSNQAQKNDEESLLHMFQSLDDDEKTKDERKTTAEVPLDGYDVRGFLDDAKLFLNPKTLRGSASLEDFWNFLETTFINVLFWDNWYSNEDPMDKTIGEDKQLLFSSQLLGVPRIRQVKVRSDSCNISPTVQHYFNTCMTYYSTSVEDMSSIRPKQTIKLTIPAWEYAPPSETKAWSSYGRFSTYGPGGYYFDLTRSKLETKKIIHELKENQWVTRGTRAVILDFTLYNANVNLFMVCKIIFEMPPTGGMYPTAMFEPLKFYRYLHTPDYVVLGGEIVFTLFIIYFTLRMAEKIALKGPRCLTHFGVILTVLIILLGWASIAMGFYRYFAVEQEVSDLIRRNYDTHPNFAFARFVQIDYNFRSAILLFMVWMRGILYLKYCEWILPLFRTIGDHENRNALFGLSVLFMAVLCAMAQLGYLLFGEQSEHFQSLGTSLATLFAAVIGDFDYLELERINATIAGMFFVLYTFLVFFILLMLFAAVIAHAYTMARATVSPITDRMVASYLTFLMSFGLRGRKSQDDRTIQHIRVVLRRAGYTDLEVDMFFSKYGVEADTKLTEEKKRELIEKLGQRKFEYAFASVNPQDLAVMTDDVCRLKQKVRELTRQVHKSRRQVASITSIADSTTKEALVNLETGGAGVDKNIKAHDLI